MSDWIFHVGKGHDDNPPGRGSGRYPWGSGKSWEREKKEPQFSQRRYDRLFKKARNVGTGLFSKRKTEKYSAKLDAEIAKIKDNSKLRSKLTKNYRETLQFFQNQRYYNKAVNLEERRKRLKKAALKTAVPIAGSLILIEAIRRG